MGLFDHLFKPRPDGDVERVVEAPLKASRIIEMREEGVEREPPPDPAAAFLQPKGYAPGSTGTALGGQNQGFVPVLPSAKRAAPAERKPPAPDEPRGAANEVVLCVGDVLSKIPVAFLRTGSHDLKRELRFHVDDLAPDIMRGRPAIALSCIAEQAPELFHSPIGDEEDMAIRLPLQKLVEQVARIRTHAPPAAPLTTHPPVRPPVEKEKPEIPTPTPPPPIAEKKVEVPAPLPTRPAPPTFHVPPPESEPEPVTPTILQEPPMAPEPPRATEPEPQFEPEPVTPDELPPEPATANVRPAEISPVPNVIDLSLAAIVAKVPREIIAEPLPRIDETIRISLPFPMIERQLGTGVVSIPAKLFWSALPPLLKHYFVPREDLTVPLPLEEIFQNLPVARSVPLPRFEPLAPVSVLTPNVETPIVLAPAPADEGTPELDLTAPSPTGVENRAPERPAAVEPEPATEIKEVPPAPPVVAEKMAPIPAEEIVLAATAPTEASPSPVATAPPTDAPSAPVILQPFRIFHPPTPVVEPRAAPEPAAADPVLLGEAPAASPAEPISNPSSPASDGKSAPAATSAVAGAEGAEDGSTMPPPSTRSLESEPESPSQFSVLPSPAPVPEPIPAPPLPEPEAVVAFTPDQPPPLKIEEPAVAVAVLRATVAGPQELPAVAMATANIQPPQMFRPVVLPPRISGITPAPPINLAPTLAGPGSIAGMISLSPAADAHSPANFDVRGIQSKPATQPLPTEAPRAEISPPPPPPPVEAEATPAAPTESHDEPTPTLKSFVKRLFTPPAADTPPAVSPPAPPPEAGEKSRVPPPQVAPNAPPVFPAPNLSEPAPPTAPMPAPFQLHLPRLPQSAPLAAPSVEHAPPALPISPFDQHSLQSIFMTEETLDLSKISRLAAALPGIQACIIATQGKSYSSGNLPEGFDLNALRGLAPQVGAAADRLPIGQLKNFTLYGQDYSISFFERTSVCICAIHRARSFVPGVREKLVAVVDELARKGSDE